LPRRSRTLQRVLSGHADTAIRFRDFIAMIRTLGFSERVRGDHYIYSKQGIPEIINVQPLGSLAKAYQVRQVRLLIQRYGLGDAHDE
jgi:hypothetical protein